MRQLLTPEEAAQWLRARVSGELRTDSRLVQAGDGFVAWPGATTDARQHVNAALAQGAAACLVEHTGVAPYGFDDERVASYSRLKAGSGPIAAEYFGRPTVDLKVLAVTGTNGKTSVSWWLAQALSNLKQAPPIPCALVGTLGVGRPPRPGADADAEAASSMLSTGMTTPDPILLQHHFRQFLKEGVQACAIEASSIGIEERRLDGTRIHTAVFTNFTQDHLDYHGTMAAYWQAKAQLFIWPGLQAAVINIDDIQGADLAASLGGHVPDLWTVSCVGSARLQAREIHYDAQGLRFTLVEVLDGSEGGEECHAMQTHLIGTYNVANVLGVIAAMRSLGVSLAAAAEACLDLTPVPGRMECVGGVNQPLVAVDYAHTPDAIGKALEALRPLALQRGGQLWCVFGCGGNRDASKRPLMGAMAGRHADIVVVTSDNPRDEKPEAIISQILLGLSGHVALTVLADRAEAIAETISLAAPEDVLLVAGKGHEDYQEVAGVRLPFSDLIQVHQALAVWTSPGSRAMTDMMTLQQVMDWLSEAQLVANRVSADAVAIRRVHTDTRTIEPGDLFVALRGERFDGNEFLVEAKARGAVAAICQGNAEAPLLEAGLPGLVVQDAKIALGQLATCWRAQFSLPVIAVTGSNGKTTVTQMIAAILAAFKPQACLATQGNFNNDIGVPLTVLRLRAHHEVAVMELGMNHPGEIGALAAMAQPTVALVNNAQREHLEFMATVDAVAQENGAVIGALGTTNHAVFPSDDLYTPVWAAKAGSRPVMTFGATAPAPVHSIDAQWLGDAWRVTTATPAGVLHYDLHIAGLHNVRNSLAAIACALAAGIPLTAIEQGLSNFQPVKGRSRAVVLSNGQSDMTLIDDTYNANPDSVAAAIEVLAALPGPRLLVLGDMGEVGDQGPQFHAEAGALAQQRGIDALFTLGELSQAALLPFGPRARHFESMELLQAAVMAEVPGVNSVLVKGSRFMKMEQVVAAISAHLSQLKETTPMPVPSEPGAPTCC